MTKIFRVLLPLLLAILFSCQRAANLPAEDIQIAFMADVHLQDIYGEFSDNDYKGVLNPETGKYTLARTMEAQLHSTRLFNENYFAFLAALDDVVKRGVKYVVLPGDFSDDGQPLNVRGLKVILDKYSNEFGLTFIATTGNHDLVRPFTMDAGKRDFLGEGGKNQPIMSRAGLYATKSSDGLPVVVTKDIASMGYGEIIETLGSYGFYPKKEDLYWETPFSTYGYDDYQFDEALNQASLEKRTYEIPPYSTTIPDVSYLTEPIKGVWLLAIDANVYIPKEQVISDPENPTSYNGTGIGYNQVLSHKTHLVDWIKRVVSEANKRGKTLVAFSHYPMIDFNDDASDYIEKLLGEGKMQLNRIPSEDVAQTFADAGIKIHFGGHMHINDTGVRTTKKGNILVNVQIPSLAAYIPAYKLLTFKSGNLMDVQTIVIDSVSRFKELFPLYEMEHAFLEQSGAENRWSKKILQSATYKDYTLGHLEELVRLRFLPEDWPVDLREFLLNATGTDLLAGADSSVVNQAKLHTSEFERLTGFDLVYDLYRLRSADQLALPDIGVERIDQYKILIDVWQQSTSDSELSKQLKSLAEIFHRFLNGTPSNHFLVNLNDNVITDISEQNK